MLERRFPEYRLPRGRLQEAATPTISSVTYQSQTIFIPWEDLARMGYRIEEGRLIMANPSEGALADRDYGRFLLSGRRDAGSESPSLGGDHST